jgi:hypothetical protein
MDALNVKEVALAASFTFLYVEARSFDKGYRQRKKK